MESEIRYWKKRVDLGLVLLVQGVSFGRVLFEVLRIDQTNVSFSFSYIFLIVGVLLVIDYRNLFKFRFPRLNLHTVKYLFFLLFIIITLMRSSRAESSNYIHIMFSIAAIFAISTQDCDKTSEKFLEYMFWTGAAYTIYLGYVSTDGFRDFSFYSVQALQYGASKMSTTRGVLYALTAMILYRSKNNAERIVKSVFLICAIFTMLKVRVRTVFISLFLSLIVLLFMSVYKINKRKAIRLFFCGVIILLGGMVLLREIPGLGNKIFASFQTTIDAVRSFITRNGTDASASIRVGIISWVIDYLNNNSNLFTILFGFSYVKYLDMPIIQAFFDFGIMGLVYVYYMVFKPISFIKPDCLYTAFQKFFIIFMVQNIVDQIAYMVPYEYQFHIRVIFMLQILEIELRKPKINRNNDSGFVAN